MTTFWRNMQSKEMAHYPIQNRSSPRIMTIVNLSTKVFLPYEGMSKDIKSTHHFCVLKQNSVKIWHFARLHLSLPCCFGRFSRGVFSRCVKKNAGISHFFRIYAHIRHTPSINLHPKQKPIMATKNQINKYVWLVETISRAHRITYEDINRQWMANQPLSDGNPLPLRTFHKWRIAVEEMFGLNIENEQCGAYRYYIENEEELAKPSIHSWMLDTISTSNLFLENQNLKDRILLEDVPSGREYLQPILDAMKKNRLIHFTYYNYWRGDYRQHYVEPYCVKLFRQRWYLVARVFASGAVIVYSLDRMSEFRLSSHTFQFPEDFDPEQYFDGCFGVIAGDDTDREHVVLKVSAGQANYLRALPLHPSQSETEQNDEYSLFELDIRPSFDFQQEILWNGEDIEVLQPLWLRKEIAGKIKRMCNKYKEDKE